MVAYIGDLEITYIGDK